MREDMAGWIDWHCDTLMQAWFRRQKDITKLHTTMLNIDKLAEGKAGAQFFAIYLQSLRMKKYFGWAMPSDDQYIELLMRMFYRTLANNKERIAFAGSYEDLKKNQKDHKISAFLSIEDGRAVDGRMEKLQEYHDKGVRLLTLTWNYPNCFGFPNSQDQVMMNKGLTAFGKEAVSEMNRLGILIDVSHLSDGGFWDVARESQKPFVASHSNARALCAHTRNLTDEMIRTIGEKGGLIGLNQGPKFLVNEAKENHVEDMVRHLKHMIQKGGLECAALGSDFDGISGKLTIRGPQQYDRLFDAMKKAGFSEDEMDYILRKNSQRVIQEGMK